MDPATSFVYLTEDQGTSGFYRFVPQRRGELTAGQLQMLKIVGVDGNDARTGQEQGVRLPVEWVDIADPDPADAESDALAVFRQGAALGGATFGRLEGAWFGNQAVYFQFGVNPRNDEWCGATFSPDGKVLFALQGSTAGERPLDPLA